jgi:hypothetical protein
LACAKAGIAGFRHCCGGGRVAPHRNLGGAQKLRKVPGIRARDPKPCRTGAGGASGGESGPVCGEPSADWRTARSVGDRPRSPGRVARSPGDQTLGGLRQGHLKARCWTTRWSAAGKRGRWIGRDMTQSLAGAACRPGRDAFAEGGTCAGAQGFTERRHGCTVPWLRRIRGNRSGHKPLSAEGRHLAPARARP